MAYLGQQCLTKCLYTGYQYDFKILVGSKNWHVMSFSLTLCIKCLLLQVFVIVLKELTWQHHIIEQLLKNIINSLSWWWTRVSLYDNHIGTSILFARSGCGR